MVRNRKEEREKGKGISEAGHGVQMKDGYEKGEWPLTLDAGAAEPMQRWAAHLLQGIQGQAPGHMQVRSPLGPLGPFQRRQKAQIGVVICCYP